MRSLFPILSDEIHKNISHNVKQSEYNFFTDVTEEILILPPVVSSGAIGKTEEAQ